MHNGVYAVAYEGKRSKAKKRAMYQGVEINCALFTFPYNEIMPYINIRLKESFGFKIAIQRIKRGWSEDVLAEHINTRVSSAEGVTEETVQRWESNREVPSGGMINLLIDILIEDNPDLDIKEKSTARQEFQETAEKTRRALESGKISEDLYAFSDTLKKYRRRAGLQTEGDLVERINQNKLETPIEALDIWKYEHEHEIPSKNVVNNLVRALGRDNSLTSGEKREIYDTYEEIYSIAGGTSPKSIPVLKKQLQEFFVDETGKQMSGASIAKTTEISQPTISRVFDSRQTSGVSEEVMVNLEEGLRTIGKSEEDIHRFHILLNLLNSSMGEERYIAVRDLRS